MTTARFVCRCGRERGASTGYDTRYIHRIRHTVYIPMCLDDRRSTMKATWSAHVTKKSQGPRTSAVPSPTPLQALLESSSAAATLYYKAAAMESVVDTAAAATRPPRPRAPARLSPPAGAQPTQHLYRCIYSGSVNQSLTADPPTYRNPVCLRLLRCTFCTEILHANFPHPFPQSFPAC